jgi:hypothetical protein
MSPYFANAPALLIDWLRDELAGAGLDYLEGVVVGGTVPPERDPWASSPLLVVRRSGGVAQTPIRDRPRLDFLHWHSTEYLASNFANVTRALLLFELPGAVLDEHTIYRPTEFAGPSLYPDPAGSSVPIVMYSLEVPIRVRSRAPEVMS